MWQVNPGVFQGVRAQRMQGEFYLGSLQGYPEFGGRWAVRTAECRVYTEYLGILPSVKGVTVAATSTTTSEGTILGGASTSKTAALTEAALTLSADH